MMRIAFILLLAVTASGQTFSRTAAFKVAAASTLNNGLEAHWLLDETSGTRNDSFGTNHLTDGNTVPFQPGVKGNSADFTPANQESLSIADNASLSFGDEDATITGWVYLNFTNINHYVITKGDTSGNYDLFIFVDLATGNLSWRVSSSGTAPTVLNCDTPILSPTTWYFFWCEHDSVGNVIRISVNDGTKYSTAHTGGFFNGTSPFTLGGQAPDTITGLDGFLDEVRVYRRKLTDSEISQLSANPPP